MQEKKKSTALVLPNMYTPQHTYTYTQKKWNEFIKCKPTIEVKADILQSNKWAE